MRKPGELQKPVRTGTLQKGLYGLRQSGAEQVPVGTDKETGQLLFGTPPPRGDDGPPAKAIDEA